MRPKPYRPENLPWLPRCQNPHHHRFWQKNRDEHCCQRLRQRQNDPLPQRRTAGSGFGFGYAGTQPRYAPTREHRQHRAPRRTANQRQSAAHRPKKTLPIWALHSQNFQLKYKNERNITRATSCVWTMPI